MGRVLLVQTGFLGDIVLSAPAIEILRDRYPQDELWLLTTPTGGEIYAEDSRLHGILTFSKRDGLFGIGRSIELIQRLRSMSFDRVFSLHKSSRTSIILRLAGIPHRRGFKKAGMAFLYNEVREYSQRDHAVIRNMSLFTEEDLALDTIVQRYGDRLRLKSEDPSLVLKKYGIEVEVGKYGIVCPGSKWRTKRWSADKFKNVVRMLEKTRDCKILVCGSEDERDVCGKVAEDTTAVNLAGCLTIREFISVVSGCEWIICNDSFPLHVASAFKRKTVAIFCATVPEQGFAPYRNSLARVVQNDRLTCRPCGRHGGHICPLGTYACSESISENEVLEALVN